MNYTHGGDIFSLAGEVLDFSINLNPVGMPPCALEAAQRSLAQPACYPDPFSRELTEAIARRDGISKQNILCGNGASDLLDRLVRALRPRRALITAPTFLEYEKFLKLTNCKVNFHYKIEKENFCLRDNILSEITREMDLVILCDPNNPTGRLIDLPLLQAILSHCRKVGALLVVDQCFLDLTSVQPGRLVDELKGGGLLLLRALTKSYAMAGLRVGYCLSGDLPLLERMAQLGQPWPVSTPAQAAAAAALNEAPDWPQRSLDLIVQQRQHIAEALNAFGAKVFPSDANFLLLRWRDDTLKEKLLNHGILIRQCGDFRGLGPDYFRIAVRTVPENDRLIQALGQIGVE